MNKATFDIVLTFDDLPIQGILPPNMAAPDVLSRICRTLAQHEINQAYGFLIGCYMQNNSQGSMAVDHWLTAGHKLGNHSWSHIDINKMSVHDFIHDIRKNQRIIEYHTPNAPLFFRYPFLSEGSSTELRTQVRTSLLDSGYHITPCTFHNMDFAWNELCFHAIKYDNTALLHDIKRKYLRYSAYRLFKAMFLSHQLFQRTIPQIMLLHFCTATALFLPDLLDLLKKSGAHFITLEQAVKDPIYDYDSKFISPCGIDLIHQIMMLQGKDIWFPPCDVTLSAITAETQKIIEFYDVKTLR